MLEPRDTEQGRIDYDREYTERFARAKAEAVGKGLKYEYPDKAGVGWKIHLAVSHNPNDPLTARIAAFTHMHRFVYKIGQGGSQEEGKGMTIYVGDRDTTEDLAQDLMDAFGKEIPEPIGDVLGEDMGIVGKVWGRFENQGDLIRNARREKYLQYGPSGIPQLKDDARDLWANPEDKLTKDERRQHAIVVLTEDYGAFFTGTRNHPL